jgi:hypothetical protein
VLTDPAIEPERAHYHVLSVALFLLKLSNSAVLERLRSRRLLR